MDEGSQTNYENLPYTYWITHNAFEVHRDVTFIEKLIFTLSSNFFYFYWPKTQNRGFNAFTFSGDVSYEKCFDFLLGE